MFSSQTHTLPLTLSLLSLLSTLLLLLPPRLSLATPVTGSGIMSNLLGLSRSSSYGSLSRSSSRDSLSSSSPLDPISASIASSAGYEWGPDCPGLVSSPTDPSFTSRRLHNGRLLGTYPTIERLCAAAHWGGDPTSNVGGVCVVIPAPRPFAGLVTGAPYGDPLLYEDAKESLHV
ncbi:MAG: hypothetical protein M1824_003952 [Vezdaea acicularis]|nr:MAG: hypothetical protein M1824_003952 [Vezdaea acicularis]